MIVSPKRDATEMHQMYGEYSGMSIELHLQKGQKWRAKKDRRYWWLTRKGTGIHLRLTDAAMWRLFEEVKDGSVSC